MCECFESYEELPCYKSSFANKIHRRGDIRQLHAAGTEFGFLYVNVTLRLSFAIPVMELCYKHIVHLFQKFNLLRDK